jgi:DNA-binding protein H-NS
MKSTSQMILLARYGSDLRDQLEESVARMIKNQVIKSGDAFYCAEEMNGFIHVWSGKGKQPQWIREIQAKGISLEQMRTVA